MKWMLMLAALFCFGTVSFAQTNEFWGTTSAGGTGDAGVIFSLDANCQNYTVRYNFFAEKPGIYPVYEPVLYNNMYYGVTQQGGANGLGVLYAYDKTTSTYTVLKNFNYEEGYMAECGLAVLNNKLYGTTRQFNGSTTKPGTIFEYDLATNTYSLKKIFTDYSGTVLGGSPSGKLIAYNNKIYGATEAGGTSLAGVLFSYDPSTDNYTTLYNFPFISSSNPNGKTPNGGLFVYMDELYGTTQRGGTFNNGVLFKYNLLTNTFSKLANFGTTASEGNNPASGLNIYNGVFYGVTSYGGNLGAGTLFSFNPVSNVLTYLYHFDPSNNLGGNPRYALTLYNNKFYGSSVNTSGSQNAIYFSFDPATNTPALLLSTNSSEGIPTGGMLADNDKLITPLYNGFLKSIDPLSAVASNVFVFNQIPNGAAPATQLFYYNGLLYGSTSVGGDNGYGVVYSFNPAGNVYTVLFHLTNRAYSLGNFTLMGTKLYAPANGGMLNGNSSQNYGAVFYIDITNNSAGFTALNPSTQGSSPRGIMVPTNNANELLLLTSTGPGISGGALNKFSTTTNTITANAVWTYNNNSFPNYTSKLTNGLIYVAAQNGGANNQGMINLYNSGVVTSFTSSTNGRGPTGELKELNGKYYICTSFNGPVGTNKGTIVEINPASMNPPTYKMSFSTANGQNPAGNMVVANSKLYGVMNGAGAAVVNSSGESMFLGRGTIFEYDPATNTYIVKHSMQGNTGQNPTSLMIAPTGNNTTPLQFLSFTAQKCNNNQVCLNWKTANEQNVSHFEIERSMDGISFAKVGVKLANNLPQNNYMTTDDIGTIQSKQLYYRIRQVDRDGKATNSTVQLIKLQNNGLISVYPNPASDKIYLTGYEKIKLAELFNANGEKIKEITVLPDIDISYLANGLYFIKVWLKSGTSTELEFIKR